MTCFNCISLVAVLSFNEQPLYRRVDGEDDDDDPPLDLNS